MEGETISQLPIVRSLGSEDADKTKEVNYTNKFYWMINKHGRRVPVPVNQEKNVLSRGFTHVDKVVQSDDPAKRVESPAVLTPMEAVAKMAEKMQESSEVTAQVLEEVSGVKRKKAKGKKDVVVDEEKAENNE